MKINGEMHYLWRAVDHEGEVLESFVTKERDKAAALKFIKKPMKRHGRPKAIITDGLRSYKAAMKELGNADKQEIGRWANNRVENSHLPFRRRERAMNRFRRMKTLQKFASVHASVHNHLQSGTPPRQPPRSTRRDAPPHWPSGGQSWAKGRMGLGALRPTGDSRRWTDSTVVGYPWRWRCRSRRALGEIQFSRRPTSS